MLYPISDIKQTGGSYRLYNLQNDGHFCHGTGATAQPSFRSYITSTTECRTTKLSQFKEHIRTPLSNTVTRAV